MIKYPRHAFGVPKDRLFKLDATNMVGYYLIYSVTYYNSKRKESIELYIVVHVKAQRIVHDL